MPTYTYKCSECSDVTEVVQKMSDSPLKDCYSCQGIDTLNRIIAPSQFTLKGTGWYETDFKNK